MTTFLSPTESLNARKELANKLETVSDPPVYA